MLNPFGSYIAGHRGRTKEMRLARVLAHVSGLDWTITLEDTGGVVTATLLPAITLTTGQLVVVSRLSAAGAPNAGFYIVGAINNAMPAAPPVTDTHAAETITRIVPESVTLLRDGTPVTITIYGVGLVTAPTYGSADIVDDSAPVITPTQITLSVACSAPYGGVADTYSLTVAGRTIASYFTIAAGAAWPSYLWFSPDTNKLVYKVDPAGGLLATIDLTATLGGNLKTFTGFGEYVYIHAGTKLTRLHRITGAVTQISTTLTSNCNSRYRSAVYGLGWLWLCGATAYRVNPATGAETVITTTEAAITRIVSCDATWVWAIGGNYLFRIDPTTLAYTAYLLFSNTVTEIAGERGGIDDGTSIWLCSTQRIFQIDKATCALVATSGTIFDAGLNSVYGFARTSNGKMYAFAQQNGVADKKVLRVDPTSLAVDATSNLYRGNYSYGAAATDGTSVWVGWPIVGGANDNVQRWAGDLATHAETVIGMANAYIFAAYA